jgi:large subunit ribosomal protein L7/L12
MASMSAQDAELVDLWLTDPGPRPIRIYQRVDHLTSVNLKQARKLVDSAPGAILTKVPRRQAEALKVEFEATGATVEIRPAGAAVAATDLT